MLKMCCYNIFSSRCHLEASWRHLGRSWGHLGAILASLGVILGNLGLILGSLVGSGEAKIIDFPYVFECFCVVALFALTSTVLLHVGSSWRHLGAFWGDLGAILEASRTVLSCLKAEQAKM